MTPNTDNIVINNVQDTIEQTSKTYYLNIEKNTISKFPFDFELYTTY